MRVESANLPQVVGPYDHLYASRGGGMLWDGRPGRLVLQIDKWMAEPGRILDVGCGDGKNAIELERRGFQVEGLDISSIALHLLVSRAYSRGVRLHGQYTVCDVADFPVDANRESFDAILSYGLFHCLDHQLRGAVHRRLLRSLRVGGLLIFSCLLNGRAAPLGHFTSEIDLPGISEVREVTEGLVIEHFETGTISEHHLPLVGPHSHDAVWLIGRKQDQ